MPKYIVQHRRGSTDQLQQSNVIPRDGEIVVEHCDNNISKLKVGDGKKQFSDLPYVTSELETAVDVINSRMDAFVALPEGSTQGDSELTDIRVSYNGTIHSSAGEAVRSLGTELDDLRTNLQDFIDADAVDGLFYENNLLYLTADGVIVSEPVEIKGGSGGGGGTSYNVRIINGMSSNTLSVATSDQIMLSASFYEYYGEVSTDVNGTLEVSYKLSTDTEWIFYHRQTVPQNTPFSVNVADILTQGQTTNIQFVVTGGESNISRSLTYNVTQVEASISAVNFDATAVYTGNINFQYKCIGRDLRKTVYFEIDGEVCDAIDVGTSHNSVLSHTIQMMGKYEYGAHNLRVYFKTTDGAVSNILKYAILYNDGKDTKPMVGVVCEQDEITYGDILSVDYIVYTPKQETTDKLVIRVYGEDDKVYEKTELVNVANNTQYTWQCTSYPLSGIAYVEFTSGETIKIISVIVNEIQSEYDLNQVYTNLVYTYNANGRSNNDAGKNIYEYEYTTSNGTHTTIEGQFNDFNWVSNGYVDGESLTLSGDARHIINLPMFSTSYVDNKGQTINLENATNATVTTNGRTFEVEFKVSNVTDINAHIIKCMSSDHAGFVVTPQSCYLLSSNGANIQLDATGFIENEENIAAAYIKDNTRIRLSFVIEPKGSVKYTLEDGTDMTGQCVNIYINGQFANSFVYPDNARFTSSEFITMGSNTCILNVYDVRIYNRGLSEIEILQNYKASPLSVQDKILRFEDNDVLTDNDIDYYKAIYKYPCLLITGPLSPYKGANGVKMEGKVESGVTLTKPNGNNGYTVEWDLLDKDLNGNWVSCNNVQGTSSQKFPLKNYKVYLVKNLYNEDGTPQIEEKDGVRKIKTKKVKYSLKGKDANGNDLSIGESTLCFKADYMSSDHANTFNANLADSLFDDVTESQQADPRVQNTVYGFRCLLFRRDDIGAPIEFVSDGALNNDKGNTKTFGLECDGDSGNNTTRQKWEFLNNTEALTSFQTDRLFEEVISEGKKVLRATQGLESTYPDQGDLEDEGLEPKYDYIQTLYTWVCQRANFWDASTDTVETPYLYKETQYYTEREYRKAIFINEFDKHFNKNHALIYYLFMEFTALCDNRAKNMFLRCENVHTEKLVDKDGNEVSILDCIEQTTGIVDVDRIDWESSTFAVWITDLYDLDSCYGVENSGYMQIPYYADWDYRLNGTQKFNGRESRLWLMFEEALAGDIMAKAQLLTERGVGEGGLNYENLYDTHIKNNALLVCPAVVNRDMVHKYTDPWIEGFVDYSMEGTPIRHISDYKYLQRGSRTQQKDAFIYRRSNMLYSKYQCKKFLNNNINFRVGADGGVPATESGIDITANQSLYPAVKYGDGDAAVVSGAKAAGGVTTTITKPGSTSDDKVGFSDTVYIAGGTLLTDIGDVSKFKPYEVQLQNATGLRRLILGSSEEGYENVQLKNIDTSGCKILEELNVMGCTALGVLDLSRNGLLRKLYASNSSVQSVILPNGGVIEELYLGDVVDLDIMNQSNLSVFNCTSYDSLTRLRIENTPNIPTLEIVSERLSYLTGGLRLVGINETVDDASVFDLLTSNDALGKYIDNNGTLLEDTTIYPYISGNCHIKHLTGAEIAKINECYPYLTITYDTLESQLIFMADDGVTELCRQTVMNGGDGSEPVLEEIPTRESTYKYTYTFSGWSKENKGAKDDDALKNIEADRKVYPAFDAIIRRYTVRFYNGNVLLKTMIVDAEQDADYGDTTGIMKPNTDNPGLYEFTGWTPNPTNIVKDTDCYAQFALDAEDVKEIPLGDILYTIDDVADTLSITKYIGVEIAGVVPSEYDVYTAEYQGEYTVVAITGFRDTNIAIIELPDTIETIGSSAFYNCSNLESITLLDGVKTIENSAFQDCSSLMSMDVPDTVTRIGAYAFAACKELANITIGDGVNSIGSVAFEGCTGLDSVYINDLANWCQITFGNYSSNPLYYADNLYINGELVTEIDIPDSVLYISNYAFNGCKSITSVTINHEILGIGSSAFNYCDGLNEVHISDVVNWCNIAFATPQSNPLYYGHNLYLGDELVVDLIIPDGGTKIGQSAFYNCTSLESVVVSDSITFIDNFAFSGCGSLESITFGDNVTSFGSSVFNNCSKLLTINVSDSNEYYKAIDGNLYSKNGDSFVQYAIGKSDSVFIMPDGVTTICSYAFQSCANLTTVELPESLLNIEASAFYGCTGLTEMVIPDGVTNIDGSVFHSCRNLESISLPETVTNLGALAFYDCIALSNITIPSKVKTIGNYTFSGCDSLVDVIIPDSVQTIGLAAFRWCNNLESVTIGNGVTSIGENTFDGCDKLVTINVSWSEGDVAGAPWGAQNAIINYNYVGE